MYCVACGEKILEDDRFCGECGSPISHVDAEPGLFPLFGVSLGRTTVGELERLGSRANAIDKNTGAPYPYYEIRGINFWYDDSQVANRMYLARGIHAIPPPWQKLGLNWTRSYDEWLVLLTRLGFEVTVESEPRIEEYGGHDSFCALVRAHKPPVQIALNFNYNSGTRTDSKSTLYSLGLTGARLASDGNLRSADG